MADSSARQVLSNDAAAQLTEFARRCKAAARAVSLYPAGHPTIAATLSRLAQATAQLSEHGPFRLQVAGERLLVDGAASPRPELAVAELAALLHRHLIGALTLNAAADTESWRTLLLLLARSTEDVRADGGIAHLWATAGGPSIEIEEIDYAELLREKQGLARTIDEILAAATAGPRLQLDDTSMRTLLDFVRDPAKLRALVAQLESPDANRDAEGRATIVLKIARELTMYVSRTDAEELPALFQQLGQAARLLSADSMLALLAKRSAADTVAAGVNLVSAVIDGMTDEAVAGFVASSVIAERSASERLAHAFRALVPDIDRQRRLLALARDEVSSSELGRDDGFAELWHNVEGMLTSYSDASFVSDEYARELAHARTQPVDVECASDDPPDRIAAWLSSVSDGALRDLDRVLLVDLLAIETDPLRWRDIAETVIDHADDLVRVGYFDEAWELLEAILAEAAKSPDRQKHATKALELFVNGAMMKHVAPHLRGADDGGCARFARLCHAIGPSTVQPLAEVLAAEQDARIRRRLRDILIGFGPRGRDAVQQLMNAQNWEVRRTAAYLLREFGGADGLEELVPLLADPEPLVRREAVQGLVFHGSRQAAAILVRALAGRRTATRQALVSELTAVRDERAAPLFCHLVRQINRRALPELYVALLEALAASKTDDSVEALTFALQQGDWWTPVNNRRFRTAAAQSLRRIGTSAAVEALRRASTQGPLGARWAARSELSQVE
jgi:HEAT repeats/PBS lyase HEAT-like repeat